MTIWWFAWSFVASHLYDLATRGVQPPDARWQLPVLVGIVVTPFFAHGVLRARLVRFSAVLALLVLVQLVQLVDLALVPPTPERLAATVLTLVQVALLIGYTRSTWFRWHRRTPELAQADAGATLALAPILLVAVVAGALGGLVDPGVGTTCFE